MQQVIIGLDTVEMLNEMELSGPSEIDFGIEEIEDEDSNDENDEDDEDTVEDDDYDTVWFTFFFYFDLIVHVMFSFSIVSIIVLKIFHYVLDSSL